MLISSSGAWGQTLSPTRSAARLAYQRGQQALQKGDFTSARADFEEAVRGSPTNAEAHAALGWGPAQQAELDSAGKHLKGAHRLKTEFADSQVKIIRSLQLQGK